MDRDVVRGGPVRRRDVRDEVAADAVPLQLDAARGRREQDHALR